MNSVKNNNNGSVAVESKMFLPISLIRVILPVGIRIPVRDT